MLVKNGAIWAVSDIEGPQVLNDNAQEIAVAFARQCGLGEEVGRAFYARMSNIDDIWGDFYRIPQDPAYSSGHTLKVVLPFFRAMGATEQGLVDFSGQSLRVVPHIKETLANLQTNYNVWMISTSYSWFVQAFCDRVGFDINQAHCTFVKEFDRVQMTGQDSLILLNFMEEVAEMPLIEYDGKTGVVIPKHQSYYDRITSFVWDTVYKMPVGAFLRDVHPVGQAQKRQALEDVCRTFNVPKKRVMYIGDSQTDVQIVEWLKGEGLSVMFNGKGQVFALSDIAYIGEDARAINWIANTFSESGRNGALNWYKIRRSVPGSLIEVITPENVESLEAQSLRKRKQFRGVAIGELS